jgi:hypothetical protein
MSNFHVDETFDLSEIAAMPRGMTLAEAQHYLMTDELPDDDPFKDISLSTSVEDQRAQRDEDRAQEEFDDGGLSDAEVDAFLSGESTMTAAVTAAGFHEDQHRDSHGRWAKGIPAGVEPRQLGIHFYSGAGFRQLNEALRKGSGVKHISRSIVPNTHKGDYRTTITLNGATAVRHLDAAIDDSPVDHDTTLYRGTTAFHTPNVGDVFTDKGYTSTSSDRNRAAVYYGGNGRLLWEITVPKGERALPIDEGPNTHEKEVLLPRGSSFRITDVSMDDRGQTIVKARVVHEDGQDIIAAGFLDVTAAAGGDQWKHELRDGEGQWTETPGGGVSGVVKALKKFTPTKAIHRATIPDGEVVAQRGNERMRWDQSTKKFLHEKRKGDAWGRGKPLTKKQAYDKVKTGDWQAPEVEPRAGTFIGNVPETHQNARPQMQMQDEPSTSTTASNAGDWQPHMPESDAKAWANDSVVKVPVYHGTVSAEDAQGIFDNGFSLEKIGSGDGTQAAGHGLYFTPAQSKANAYAQKYDFEAKKWRTGKVVASYVRLQNPMSQAEFEELVKRENLGIGAESAKRVTDYAKSKGYDGIYFEKGPGTGNDPEVVVFDPKQVVSYGVSDHQPYVKPS